MTRCKALGSFADGFEAGRSSTTLASVANAVPKPTSVAASPSSPTKSKSWLAALAIGAVTAGVVASGLEQAPVTGRMQLLLTTPFTLSHPRLQQTYPNLMPEIDEHVYLKLSEAGKRKRLATMGEMEKRFPGHTLCQEAQQLLDVTYARLAAAVDKLAESRPELERHLANMPDMINLGGTCPLQPHMVQLPIISLQFRMPAGAILPLQSADELLSATCRGAGSRCAGSPARG